MKLLREKENTMPQLRAACAVHLGLHLTFIEPLHSDVFSRSTIVNGSTLIRTKFIQCLVAGM